MKDPSLILRKAYYDNIKDTIEVDGRIVPIYSRVPKNVTYPYIYINSQTGIDDSNKSTYVIDSNITIEIVNGFETDYGNLEDIDFISNEIMLNVVNCTFEDLLPEWLLLVNNLLDVEYQEDLTPTHLVIRKVLRFKNILEQQLPTIIIATNQLQPILINLTAGTDGSNYYITGYFREDSTRCIGRQ